jgi:ABC-type Zn uptake system ZnuABC Zn-binding protein ZnuA
MNRFPRLLALAALSTLHWSPTHAWAQTRVLTSTPILENIVEELNCASKQFEISSLLPRGTDPHTYVPTPQALLLLKSQTHLVVVGKRYEHWFARLKPSPKTRLLVLGDELKLTDDPHFWHSPTETGRAAEKIAAFLRSTTPGINGEQLSRCLARFQEKITTRRAALHKMIEAIPPDQRSIATNHDGLRYFGKEYAIRIQPLLGMSSEEKPSPEDLRRLTRELQSKRLRAIFLESGSSTREIESVARSANIPIGGTLIVDSLTEGPPAPDILELWTYNMKTIIAAFQTIRSAQ